MNDVHLIASGSRRGWSDVDGEMTNEEADWIVKAGQYGIIHMGLLRAISASEIDAALDCEFGPEPK